jgi:hypothetical protein
MTEPNPRVKQILQDISKESLEYQPEGYKHTRYVDYTELAQQVVGETITAILCAKFNDIVLTTHDADIAQSTQSCIIDAVRNHWNFK